MSRMVKDCQHHFGGDHAVPHSRVPMFDGEGNRLAGYVGETARHAARSARRTAFARGVATRWETISATEQHHTDRRGERGSHPQNATLRLTISLQKSKGQAGLVQQRCTDAGDRWIQRSVRVKLRFPRVRERESRPAVVNVRNHGDDESESSR